MRIGRRGLAEEALDMSEHGQEDNGVLRRMCGGGNRNVYSDVTSNVVYKVQTEYGPYMRGYGNRAEYDHARHLRAKSEGGWLGRVYIPAVSGYSIGSELVIAMERIDGEAAQWEQSGLSKVRQEALWQLFMLGFGDMHAGNYIWLPSRRASVAPVDMGSVLYRANVVNNADTRVLSGTPHGERLSKHRDWWWRNRDRHPRYRVRGGQQHEQLAPSCPCGCGAVAWYA